ncbi:shikimate kinase [Lipingzhangella sp. LS1_29]|uniref:Shikimate kinase n=1 Tax=Lipingzhangella rawalii TaxID=2055835 RepID=A0ABU2H350_9ACTN|nr:shikimate kinase [Lipingzhangella rawalii]MDS1269417.1 shikimate kinase [Lipingzhangella rawalii]
MGAPLAVLIGAPGAGKSSVGSLLAERLGVRFVDTDAVIEDRAGKAIGDIFVEDGENTFRELERVVVAETLHTATGVVALGGGAALREETQQELAGHHVVYLEVPFEEAVKRVGLAKARPLLAGNPRAQLKKLLQERTPVYERLASTTVSTADQHPEEIVDTIVLGLAQSGVGEAEE